MARLRERTSETEAKASLNRAQYRKVLKSYVLDTKPSDLSMARLKQR